MDPNTVLAELVRKISEGTATDADKQLFGNWMLQLDLSPADIEKALTPELRAAMLDKIVARPQKTKSRILIYATSAAAILLLTVGVLWKKHIINLGGDGLTTIANTGHGVKYIQLPDKSEVWLNSGSTLSFSADEYNSSERHLDLQGEGYFEVVAGVKPFVVSTGGIDTRVLGTGFNIENYPGESEVRVTLVHGKVMLEDKRRPGRTIVLTPDEVVHYQPQKDDWTLEHTHAGEVTQWIQGHLVFHELPLKEALGRMEKKYGVTFQYDSALLAGKTVTANFGPKPWTAILDDMLFVHDLAYHRKNGVIYITKQ